MQKINKKWPINAEQICEENNLIVEQAYILLEQGKEQQAQDLLMKKSNSEDMEKCIQLALKYGFIDKFINTLIERASQNND